MGQPGAGGPVAVGEGRAAGWRRPSGQMGGRWRDIEATAYCSCGYCCNWEHGLLLGPCYVAFVPKAVPVRLRRRVPSKAGQRPALFDRYWSATNLKGQPYAGTTATMTRPRQARRGPLHPSSLAQPAQLLVRAALFPVLLLGQRGTIAADPQHYPFGTKMFVPGYGWGTVEDVGGAIKGERARLPLPSKRNLPPCARPDLTRDSPGLAAGPERVDLNFRRHRAALEWGRRRTPVKVVRRGQCWTDRPLWGPLQGAVKALDATFGAVFL